MLSLMYWNLDSGPMECVIGTSTPSPTAFLAHCGYAKVSNGVEEQRRWLRAYRKQQTPEQKKCKRD
jgi:hypothetical protein